MRLLGYERQTTLWEDFSVAEIFGEEAIRDTYKRAKTEWKRDRVYGTELSMALNHRVGIGTRKITPLVNFTLNCGKSTMTGCLIIGRIGIWGIT